MNMNKQKYVQIGKQFHILCGCGQELQEYTQNLCDKCQNDFYRDLNHDEKFIQEHTEFGVRKGEFIEGL